jgi:hypothetical protein
MRKMKKEWEEMDAKK